VGILRRFVPNRLPVEAAQALELGVGERVLAWSPLAGGGVAAATVEGLHVRTPTGGTLHGEWAQVLQAAWEAGSGTLAVTWAFSRQITALELSAPGRFPEVVHERVRSSLLLSQQVAVSEGRSVWVALRRLADGRVVTQVVPGPGVWSGDLEVTERVRRVEAGLCDEAGTAFGTVRDADPA
jgi:hypothetical protein